MSEKSDHRLSKLASFGASAGRKQVQASTAGRPSDAVALAAGSEAAPIVPPMIRNIAFTLEEQKILRDLMEAMRDLGELTPNLSLAVKAGLRLVPHPISKDALRTAVRACKALDGRRKEAKRSKGN